MKILSQKNIRNLDIKPAECVTWIKESFNLKKFAELPVKEAVHPQGLDFFTSMPCLLPPAKKEFNNSALIGHYYGVKVVHRIEGAIPSLGSDMMLYNADNGELIALVDCDWITAMRTGAVAAASALALQKSGASSYGFIGLGNTARATMLCLLSQIKAKEITVHLVRYKDQAESFISRFKEYPNIKFIIVESINEMIKSIDVLYSCITAANGNLVQDESSFPEGITIVPIHTRGFQNCDTTFDRVFGDDTGHVSGFKFFKQFHDYNEIGEVFAGRDPGRKSDNQRILSYSYGLGLHDVYFAAKIYEKMLNMNSTFIDWDKETEKFWI